MRRSIFRMLNHSIKFKCMCLETAMYSSMPRNCNQVTSVLNFYMFLRLILPRPVAYGGFWFGGGHLATIRLSRAPARGPGAKAPGWQLSLKFYNDSKYQKMNPFFKNSNSILARKIHFTKTFEKLNRFYKNFVIFSKNYFTDFNYYGAPSMCREISAEFYQLVENFIKK